jgi:hypothetical protein
VEDAAAHAKKIALLDGTSTQEAAELLPVVEDLVEEGSYNPIARVGHDLFTQPVLWVTRAMVPILLVILSALSMSAVGLPWFRVFEYCFFGFLWILLPVWSVAGVGAWMDRLAGRDPGSVPAQLRRRGRELAQALALAVPMSWVFFHATDAVSVWVRQTIGWYYSGPAAFAMLVFGSLIWGFFATSLVVRGRAAPMALCEGVVESVALVVRTPWKWIRWLGSPDHRRLQAGEGMMIPYLLFVWVATTLAALGAGWLFVTVVKATLGGPTYVLRLAMTATVGFSAALAFEGAVGVGTLNYLALLVERAPAPREEPEPAALTPGTPAEP